jgi:uncharacterized protein YbjT (DUF2867 family)
MILVTGATGKVGRNVVSQLLDQSESVRALVRDPASAGLPAGVELARGDLAQPETLPSALDGVRAVFLLWPLDGDAARPVVDALAGRVERIVYLSTMGIEDDAAQQADPITQTHADLERLVEESGVEWTMLRAGGFASNTLGWAQDIKADGVVRAPFGAMARSLVHERDLAAVAVRALTRDELVGRRPAVTGPAALTQVEQARLLGEAIGRDVRFEEQPRETAREQMIAAFPFGPEMIDGMLDAWARTVDEPEPVTTAVQDITGAPARSFAVWAADHADDFR